MSMPKENNDKFTEYLDGEHKAYYGEIAELESGTYYQRIVTPYFKQKINCESYTRKLCDANDVPYSYEKNIRAVYGKWTHANGDEIDESKVPVGERFEKR